ncbi:MAG: hypothetical protein IT232_10655, partial [Flavobacteriales bacterium]|nr:hypothetical protein [Flavobacteriales bacterium]
MDINKPVFAEEPFFNSQFIQKNKIRLITGSRSSKKVKDIIRTKGLDYYYEFNTQGYLTKQMSTFHNQIEKKDTNVIIYYYNNKNLIETIRKTDSYGYFSNHFLYNDSNKVISQTYCRDENPCVPGSIPGGTTTQKPCNARLLCYNKSLAKFASSLRSPFS